MSTTTTLDPDPHGQVLAADLRQLIDAARQRVAVAVNAELSLLYWQVGQRIHRGILGSQRAGYGEAIVPALARQLTAVYGRGWGERHLRLCIRFAQRYPDAAMVHTLCAELSWSHLRLIAAVDDPLKRDFYAELCRLERWSVRQLQERMQSLLFERSAISRQPEDTIRHELQALRQDAPPSPALLLKDPYLLDFLGLNDRYLERDLEDAILRELEQFLLELGAGFTFVARQKRLQIDNNDFYIDLLLYNRKLRRLVAVELKIGDFRAEYKGQMELYLRWLAKHETEQGEQPPLGIILCTGKQQEQIELLELDKSGIHVAEYLTVLPPREALSARLQLAVHAARERLLQQAEAAAPPAAPPALSPTPPTPAAEP
jgi:predicted nuclease of restriction endonuclease-like (RecB) superfamily